MKLDKIANSGNDEFYTPPYAVQPILKYIKPNSTVWCPFDTEDSWFVKLIATLGGASNSFSYQRRTRFLYYGSA